MTIPLVTPKTIKVIGNGPLLGGYAVDATTLPGHLLSRVSTSNTLFRKHFSQGAVDQRLIALEDSKRGFTINDAYSAGDYLHILQCYPGDVFWGWLNEGETILVGQALVSAGNGNLRLEWTSPVSDTHTVGVALTSTSTEIGETKRIKVEAI